MRGIGITVALCAAVYVFSWFFIAYKIGVLFPGQMLEKYPREDQIIPLVVDFYVWADLFILSPLLGYIIATSSDRWTKGEMFIALGVGLILAVLFQRYIIMPGKYKCSLGGAGETNMLGLLHIPFFAAVVAIIGLFLITPTTSSTVLIVALAFAIFIPIDILVPLHFVKKWFGYPWIPEVFKEEGRLYWMIGIAWIGVAAGSTFKIAFQ